MEATVRDISINGITVKVWRKIGTFGQGIYEIVESPLLEYIMGIVIMSDWGMFPLPSIIKERVRYVGHCIILNGHGK